MRVEAKLHWMHTFVTPLLTWVGIHRKRGREAMEDFDSAWNGIERMSE